MSEPPAIAGGLSDALNIADSKPNPNVQPPTTTGGPDLHYTAVTAHLKKVIEDMIAEMRKGK